MGGNDRNTRTLDRDELAKLARESVEAKEQVQAGVEEREKPSHPARPPAPSRTATLQDPMTMALLAEVTRNARTREFDADGLPEDEQGEVPVPHPNVRRR